jgi:hypothetical protein
MSGFKKLGWMALLAAGLFAGVLTSGSVRAEAEESIDQGVLRSTDNTDSFIHRWRHIRWYAVVTIFNQTDQPISYRLAYINGGGYFNYVVPARGWCCHWTTCRAADFHLAVDGRDVAVQANWVCQYHRPCREQGTPVYLGGR